MKLIYSNFRKGEVKIMAENLDDLWYLSSIVDEGNLVKGSTLRKIKVGSSENQNSVKKPVFIEKRSSERLSLGSRPKKIGEINVITKTSMGGYVVDEISGQGISRAQSSASKG